MLSNKIIHTASTAHSSGTRPRLLHLHDAYSLAGSMEWILAEGQSIIEADGKLENPTLFGVSLATEYVQTLYDWNDESPCVVSRALVLQLPEKFEQVLIQLAQCKPQVEGSNSDCAVRPEPHLVFSLPTGNQAEGLATLDAARLCVEARDFYLLEDELHRSKMPAIFVPTIMIAGPSVACGGYFADMLDFESLHSLQSSFHGSTKSSGCDDVIARVERDRVGGYFSQAAHSASHQHPNCTHKNTGLKVPLAAYWSDPDFWDEDNCAPLPNPYWCFR